MCTDRLPGNYCPFGDINECNCLELFTIFGDVPEDSSYIEELLDELSTSLDDNDTTESLSEDAATHEHQRTWNTNAFQMTSTPIRRRLCYNPVLTNVESPVLGNRNTTQPENLSFFMTEPVSGISDVFKSCNLHDSLDMIGLTEVEDSNEMFISEECRSNDVTDTCSMDVDEYEIWDLDRNDIDSKFQHVLPNSASRTDSCTLFV